MKIRKERTHSNGIKGEIKNYISFYNKNLRKKHIIVYILSLIAFAIFMITYIKNINETSQFLTEIKNAQQSNNIFMDIIKEKIPLVFLIIFSGITPYVFIPIIGILGYPYILATNIMHMSIMNMIIASIGSIVQIFGVALAVAAGIYYCTCSTKKFRYGQMSTFGMDDFKEQLYEATKNEEKVNKIKDKKALKMKRREELNVKINYKALLYTFVISTVLVVVAAIITGA